jgi:hypothetical protein
MKIAATMDGSQIGGEEKETETRSTPLASNNDAKGLLAKQPATLQIPRK